MHGVLWQVYGSIFVLDASNDLRMLEVANEFQKVVKDARLNGKPMLVVANKRDLSFDLPMNAILSVLGPINSTYQAFIECNCSLLVICTYVMTLNQVLKIFDLICNSFASNVIICQKNIECRWFYLI